MVQDRLEALLSYIVSDHFGVTSSVLAETVPELMFNCDNLRRKELLGGLEHPRVFLIVGGRNL